MKSKFCFCAGLVLVLALASLWGCAEEEEEAVRTYDLSMATFWPATDFMVTQGHERWIQEVQERTDGRVNINLHAGEALLGAKEIYHGVAEGVADIGTTCPSYTPGVFPLTEAFELPGYENKNALAASWTVHEGYKRIKQDLGVDEFEDVKVLMFWATGPGNIMSKQPVQTLDDMSGLEIRAVGGTISPLEELGATTHSMPMSESYLALDQGIVDGILAPTDTLEGFRLAEVVDYVTHTPFLYNVVFMKVMNKDTWNALPPDIQEVFEELNQEFVEEYGKIRTEYTRKGLEYGIQEHGIETLELDPGQEEEWRETVEPVTENWIQRQNERGLPGREAVDIVRELDKKYSEKYSDF